MNVSSRFLSRIESYCKSSLHRSTDQPLQADTSATSAEPSDTEVSEGEKTDATDGEDTDEDIDSDCPCGKCITGREKLKKKQALKEAESEPESDADVHSHHKDKKVKDKAAAQDKQKDKSKGKNNNNSKNEKSSKKKDKPAEREAESGSETAVDSSAAEEDTEQNTKSKKQKQKGNGGNNKKAADKSEEKIPEEPAASGKKKKKDKKAKSYVQLPPRRPDLLLPVNAQVLQVEHSIEGAEDPRPNAFYDAEHGVMRVYHGGAYGNPYGALYPKRWGQSMPLGTPHPSQNPWAYGFAPSHAPVPPPNFPPAQRPATGPGPGNPWYQGQGVVQIGVDPVTPMPKDPRAPYNESPSIRAAAKKDSNNNVVPFAAPGSKAGSKGSRGIQGAAEAKDNATGGNAGDANDEAKKVWTPEESNKLDQDLKELGNRVVARPAARRTAKLAAQRTMTDWATLQTMATPAPGAKSIIPGGTTKTTTVIIRATLPYHRTTTTEMMDGVTPLMTTRILSHPKTTIMERMIWVPPMTTRTTTLEEQMRTRRTKIMTRMARMQAPLLRQTSRPPLVATSWVKAIILQSRRTTLLSQINPRVPPCPAPGLIPAQMPITRPTTPTANARVLRPIPHRQPVMW